MNYQHGWYSKKMHDLTGRKFDYLTPEGDIVEVSTITDTDDASFLGFNDIVYLGEVTRLVQRYQKPPEGYTKLKQMEKKLSNLKI